MHAASNSCSLNVSPKIARAAYAPVSHSRNLPYGRHFIDDDDIAAVVTSCAATI